MKYIKDIANYTDSAPSMVTVGKFDGLHRGHQRLYDKMRELRGQQEGIRTICFTFDRQPATTLEKKRIPLIMTPEELHEELESQGVDVLLECPFTDDVRTMEAEDFVEEILCKRLHMKHLIVGEDFHFGYKGKGDCEFLKELAEKLGYELHAIPCEMYETEKLSSTMIREMIRKGDIELANELLGHPYRFEGQVVQGKRIGHQIGVPTLNIIPDPRKVLPPNGVYAASCRLSDGRIVEGISNLGVNPTISDHNHTTLEMNLFRFEETIYQQTVEISLLKFIRAERKFGSIDALRTQVLSDIAEVRMFFDQMDPQ